MRFQPRGTVQEVALCEKLAKTHARFSTCLSGFSRTLFDDVKSYSLRGGELETLVVLISSLAADTAKGYYSTVAIWIAPSPRERIAQLQWSPTNVNRVGRLTSRSFLASLLFPSRFSSPWSRSRCIQQLLRHLVAQKPPSRSLSQVVGARMPFPSRLLALPILENASRSILKWEAPS